MKRLHYLLLLFLFTMNAIPSHATYYIVGNEPIGLGFSPDKGRAMTAHADGTYTIECGSFNGYARFVFADSLAEAGDWDTFHASMRIGPETLPVQVNVVFPFNPLALYNTLLDT